MVSIGGGVAIATSADGSVIVGVGTEPFIWDAIDGKRNLRSVLINDFGLNLSGWQLTSVQTISADGNVIVGNGIDPAGHTEAWVAVVPEPATGTILLFGALAASRSQRIRESTGRTIG
jgi:uncharacterized membrane protein